MSKPVVNGATGSMDQAIAELKVKMDQATRDKVVIDAAFKARAVTDDDIMDQGSKNVPYLVRLGKDGQWQWTASPPAKFISEFCTAFPPESTPGFLVDLGTEYKSLKAEEDWPWKVVAVQDLWLDDFQGARTLLKERWGALSYQWGEFLPFTETTPRYKYRPCYINREGSESDYKFKLPAPYIPPNCSPALARAWNWGIPMINGISVINVKKVLCTLGLRFIWWDVACLPQRDYSKGFMSDATRNPPYPGPPGLPDMLQKIAGEELLKQKFVYEKAGLGVVWLNQTNWDNKSSLKTVLLRTPRILDLDGVKTILRSSPYDKELKQDEPANKDSAAAILSNVLRGTMESIQQNQDVNNNGDQSTWDKPEEWRTAIESFVELLKKVRDEEAWFRSLWSFQEGRLLKAQAFVDINGRVLEIGRRYDEKGVTAAFPKTWIQAANGSYKMVNSPSIRELAAFATLLAGQISLAWTAFYGQGTAATAIRPLMELWDSKKPTSQMVSDSTRSCLEPIMRDLVGTGLLFNSNDSPLELLLSARRTRFPSLFFKDEYYAMTGVLGLVKMSATEDYSMRDEPWGYDGPGNKFSEDVNMAWLQDRLPKIFFQALVKRYQWLVLMLARLRVNDIVKHWGAVSMGHFETINPYCENFTMKNELNIDRKDWKYVLPQLTYDPDTDILKMTPALGTVAETTLSNGSMLKSLKAKSIICYKVTKAWEQNQILRYELRSRIVYQDDKILPGGVVEEKTKRDIKPSNVVQSKYFLPKDLEGRLPLYLIPFESLGFDLVSQNQTTGTKRDSNILNQRCLLLTQGVFQSDKQSDKQSNTQSTAKSTTQNDTQNDTQSNTQYLDAFFGGIVDVKNIVAEPLEVPRIDLNW